MIHQLMIPNIILILQARILEWIAIPFFRRSSQSRGRPQVSHIADSLPFDPPGKPIHLFKYYDFLTKR